MKTRFQSVVVIALAEAGAIMRSWGYRIAALAPFVLLGVTIAAMWMWSANDPRRAILIETSGDISAGAILQSLESHIGPSVPQTELRDAAAGLWVPTMATPQEDGYVVIGGQPLEIGGTVTITNSPDGRTEIDLRSDSAPPYMLDLLHIAVLEAGQTDKIDVARTRMESDQTAPMSLSASLLHLITVGMAAATSALGAATSHTLTTAYLAEPKKRRAHKHDAKEEFLGKLLGIGGVYAALALPWGVVAALAIAGLALAGDPALSVAMIDVGAQLLRPSRLLVFLVGALAGYTVYASFILFLALRAKTSAAARTLAGPAALIAIAPAPLALWAHGTGSDLLLPVLSWLPITAPSALQLRVDQTSALEIALPLTFLVFIAVTALRLGSRAAERRRGQHV
ncbi:MAG: hypothetical protein AAGH90_12070 [Pseudomonadota bacterium]